MNNNEQKPCLNFIKINIALTILLLSLATSSTAQVLWNLKGGLMSRPIKTVNGHYDGHNSYYYVDDSSKNIDWMAGLEMEIPLNNMLNIETGLRYANRYVTIINSDGEISYGGSFGEEVSFEGRCSLLELPVRLAYKRELGKNFSLHAGIGPYASYLLNSYISDLSVGDRFQVGLEPSVSLYWHNVNIGISYNLPCFYKGYKNENNSALMVTLGIRFKSKAWEYVGAGLMAVGTVAAAISEGQEGGIDGADYYSDDSSMSWSESSSTSSGSSLKTQYQNWERRAKSCYESLTKTGSRTKNKKTGKDVSGTNGQSLNGGNYTIQKQRLREAQSEMRKIREKARKQGVTIPQSNYETVSVSY